MAKTDLIQVRIGTEDKSLFTEALTSAGVTRAQAIRGFIDCVTAAGKMPDEVLKTIKKTKKQMQAELHA